VGRQLGVHPEALRGWVKQAEIDNGTRPGVTSDDAARIAELEREVRELRRANEILKAARVHSTGQRNTAGCWMLPEVLVGQAGSSGDDRRAEARVVGAVEGRGVD
jgi:Transposase